MDTKKDGFLQKSEVDSMMAHVPHEECLFGFMISSDADGDHVLNKEEWSDAFKYVGRYFHFHRFVIIKDHKTRP